MKKKFIPILLVIMMLISILPVHAVEAEPTFVVDSVVTEAGETVDVTISVKNNPGIASIKLSVTYDDSLTLNSITYNSTIGGMSQQPQTKDSPVTLNWFNGSADSHGDWVFATLSFTVNDNATIGDYDVTVTYEADNVYNIAEENVTFAIENGKVEVICGHNNTTNVAEIPATCAQNGFTAGVYCNDCLTYISGHKEVPATGEHTDTDGNWDFDEDGHYHICACGQVFDGASHAGGSASCNAKAVCNICGTSYGNANSNNHGDTEFRNAVAASCNSDGYTGDGYCVDCGALVEMGTVIPATGDHVDADGQWETDGEKHWLTCTCGTVFDASTHAGGEASCIKKATCLVCRVSYGTVDADAHGDTEVKNAQSASCSEDGYTGDMHCMDCGELLSSGTVIPATGNHVDADGKWENDANNHFHTCACGAKFDETAHSGGNATCIEKAACSVCGKNYGDVNSNNHVNTEIKNAANATCKDAGYTGDTCCVDCGECLLAGEEIPVNDAHSYGDWVTTKEPTEEETGLKEKTCSICGDVVSEELAKLEKDPGSNPGTGDVEYIAIAAVVMVAAIAALVLINKKKYIV